MTVPPRLPPNVRRAALPSTSSTATAAAAAPTLNTNCLKTMSKHENAQRLATNALIDLVNPGDDDDSPQAIALRAELTVFAIAAYAATIAILATTHHDDATRAARRKLLHLLKQDPSAN